MPGLKKILKPKFLEKYLGEVLRLAGDGTFAAILDGERIVAVAGARPEDLDAGVREKSLSCPLRSQGRRIGSLMIGALGPGGGGEHLKSLCDFLGYAVQDIIEREAVRRELAQETLEQYRNAALTQRAVLNLNRLMKQQEVVDALLSECRLRACQSDSGMVFLHNPGSDRFEFFDSFGPIPGDTLKKAADSELFRDVIHRREPEIVNDLAGDPRWSNEVQGLNCMMILPLASPASVHGALVLAGSEDAPPFDSQHLKRIGPLCTVGGIALSNAYNFEHIQNILNSLMRTMATTIDSRDRLTAGHSHRVAKYAHKLLQIAVMEPKASRGLSVNDIELHEIYYAGLLHDVGKIGVREEVLTKAARLSASHMDLIGMRLALWGQINGLPWEQELSRLERINRAYELSKPDRKFIKLLSRETIRVGDRTSSVLYPDEVESLLTPLGNLTLDEWEEIKRHPRESLRILQNIPFSDYFPNMLKMIVQHHERLDGSGYPEGLRGDEIMLQSRVLAIVDVYDSLRRDRHYKKALSKAMALKILRQEAALNRLDPELVEIFCENVDMIEDPAHMEVFIPPYLTGMQ